MTASVGLEEISAQSQDLRCLGRCEFKSFIVPPIAFDRRANVRLHHLALAVADRAGLDALYQRVLGWPDVVVEFAPQPSGSGPKIHFVAYEPSGARVEFTFDLRLEGVRKAG